MADLGRQLADLLYGESQQPKETTGQKIARRLTGAGETAATIGTGLLGSVPAGLAGLSQLIPTRGRAPDFNRAAQKVEDVQSALTYLPRTETGQRYLQNTAGALETLGAPAEYLGEKALQYTGSPGVATAANVLLDPVNFIGLPGSGKATVAATKAAGRAAMAAPRVATEMAGDLLMPRGTPMERQRGAIKMKGGNWLEGSVERSTRRLKSETTAGETPAQRIPRHEQLLNDPSLPPESRATVERHLNEEKQRAAIDNWIDSNLTNYIKKQMATPEDPVRRLAEEGISQFPPGANQFYIPPTGIEPFRVAAGLPAEGLAKSELAKTWENLSDEAVSMMSAGDRLLYQTALAKQNPWLKDVDPKTMTYSLDRDFSRNLGFDHIVDVLREDLATGRIRPEQLSKVSMEQAVRRTHQYDQELAERMAKATAAAREGLPVYKEYPEGLRWIELNKPGAFAAESDSMGHSVRGYEPPPGHPDWTEGSGDAGSLYYGHGGWEGIKSGRAKVYSLVDSKGAPHVTIEIARPQARQGFIGDQRPSEADYYRLQEEWLEGNKAGTVDPNLTFAQWWRSKEGIPEPEIPFEITQIKGKQNRAPKEDYLPFVQDFVKSGQWSDVRDMQNTGLFKVTQGQRLPGFSKEIAPGFYTIDDFKRMAQENEMPQEIQDAWFKKLKDQSRYGYKKGGSVRISDNPDTMRLELANGGAVGQERSIGSKLVGGGIRGAGMRAIFGMDLPEDATKAEREVYANVIAMSNTPGPWALAAAPAALVKGAKGAKAVKAAKEEAERSLPLILPRAPAKSKEEIAAHAERVGRQMLGEHVTSGKPGDTKNLAGRSRKENERIKRIEYELEAAKAVPESQVVQSQIGDINVAFPGDYSLSDVYLKTLEGEPIGSLQQGGSRFGLGKLDMKSPLFWASNEGPAQMVQNKITEVADVFNPNRVIGQHLAMGRVANNFAQHFADASLRAIDYSKVSRNDMELFDTVIAAGYEMKNPKTGERVQISFPEWPGIADPEGALAAMKKNPELRKWFLNRMKTPKLTQATNMPNGLDIEWAITSPDLRNMEVNLTGHSVGELVPGAKLTDDVAHETYSKGIRGRYLGHQEALTPFVLSFPDATQHILRTQRPQDFTGTIQKVFPHQIVDQQYLDELGQYKRNLDRVILGKKKGGAIEMASGGGVGEKRDLSSKIAGGGIRGVITRGLLGLDAPEDMTPREREIYENAVRFSAPAQGLGVGKAIFIGAKAKTWNKAAADRAVEMEKQGVPPAEIWRETGTFRGADGMLRQEISDVGATHRNPKQLQELGEAKKAEAKELQTRLLGIPGQKDMFPKALTEAKKPVREKIKQLKTEADELRLPSDIRGQSAKFVLEHPELYKAYPELGEMPVMQGVYDSGGQRGSLMGGAGDMQMSITQTGLRQDPRSTMLHEMQHAVQTLEDMAPGGSPSMAFKDPKAFEILEQLRKETYKPASFEEFQRVNRFPENEARSAYAQYLKEREANPIILPATDRALQSRAAMEYYKRLAGEAEARATQFREPMSASQRRQEFPYSSYDVLPEDLIVKDPKNYFGASSEAASIPTNAAAKLASQREELMLRSRAIQELKDQFENLPLGQQPQGWMSPERLQQKIEEIRRREATPVGGQIPLMQAGGAVKAAARAAKAAAKEVMLPASERDANLAKMLEPSKVQQRLYHGTMATEAGRGQEAIRSLKPSREGALGSGVYLTPDPEFASTYAGFPARSQLERDIATGSEFAKESASALLDRMNRGAIESHEIGGNMLPVYAQIKNPLILQGKGDPMIEALTKLGMDEASAARMVERAYDRKGYIGKEVENRARAAGYDGLMQYRDGNLSEVVVYNPRAIKSAIGNRGTFDVSSPDLSKKKGGKVKFTDNLDAMRLAVQKRK